MFASIAVTALIIVAVILRLALSIPVQENVSDDARLPPEARDAIFRIESFLAHIKQLPFDTFAIENFRLNGTPIDDIATVAIPRMARDFLSMPIQIRTRVDGNGACPEQQFVDSLIAMESALKAIFGSSVGGRLARRSA